MYYWTTKRKWLSASLPSTNLSITESRSISVISGCWIRWARGMCFGPSSFTVVLLLIQFLKLFVEGGRNISYSRILRKKLWEKDEHRHSLLQDSTWVQEGVICGTGECCGLRQDANMTRVSPDLHWLLRLKLWYYNWRSVLPALPTTPCAVFPYLVHTSSVATAIDVMHQLSEDKFKWYICMYVKLRAA